MKKQIIYFVLLIFIIGIVIVAVRAQVENRISTRCNANGIVEVDYAYKIHTEEGYTNYIAILEAGRCKKEFRGQIDRTSNVESAIQADISAQIEARNLYFYPDPFGQSDVDGRGSFSIP